MNVHVPSSTVALGLKLSADGSVQPVTGVGVNVHVPSSTVALGLKLSADGSVQPVTGCFLLNHCSDSSSIVVFLFIVSWKVLSHTNGDGLQLFRVSSKVGSPSSGGIPMVGVSNGEGFLLKIFRNSSLKHTRGFLAIGSFRGQPEVFIFLIMR